mmetsp:Transcript_10360/g.11822  ORF Transcript_10360/g.11822 Transcript_10360/m.11822 type:complete len:217 (-) Transcript_10360:921-1571(-)
MSIPLETASVATNTSTFWSLNLWRANSRCPCERSPWIWEHRTEFCVNCLEIQLATCFLFVKTIVGFCWPLFLFCSLRIWIKTFILSFLEPWPSILTMRCSTDLLVAPTFPTATRAKLALKYDCSAMARKAFGKVAENRSVCRSARWGMLLCSTILRNCGSNPISSIRSASSNTRNLHFSNDTRSRSKKSTSRPGVATRISTPLANASNCGRAVAPP